MPGPGAPQPLAVPPAICFAFTNLAEGDFSEGPSQPAGRLISMTHSFIYLLKEQRQTHKIARRRWRSGASKGNGLALTNRKQETLGARIRPPPKGMPLPLSWLEDSLWGHRKPPPHGVGLELAGQPGVSWRLAGRGATSLEEEPGWDGHCIWRTKRHAGHAGGPVNGSPLGHRLWHEAKELLQTKASHAGSGGLFIWFLVPNLKTICVGEEGVAYLWGLLWGY